MEISACPKCGSKKIFQGKLKEGVLTGITTKYVCSNCGYQGFPILFENEEEYKKFKKQFDDKNQNKENVKELPKKTDSFIKNNIPIKLGLGLIIIGILLSAGTLGVYIIFTALLIIDGIALLVVGLLSPKKIDIKKIKNYPKFAGYIMIISGLVLLILYIFELLFSLNLNSMSSEITQRYIANESFLIYSSIMQIIFSLFEILGGIFALFKEKWGIAVIGAILGSLILVPYYLATILSIIAIAYLSFSKDIFDKKGKKL